MACSEGDGMNDVVRSKFVCPVCEEPVKGEFPAELLLEIHQRHFCGREWLEDDDD
jgi:hypothetical protein